MSSVTPLTDQAWITSVARRMEAAKLSMPKGRDGCIYLQCGALDGTAGGSCVILDAELGGAQSGV